MKRPTPSCPDCESIDRRDLLKAIGGAAAAGAVGSTLWTLPGAYAAPSPTSTAESAVGRFYATLSDDQKQAICFPFDNPLRQRINANWHITKTTIGKDFNAEQKQLINEIVRNVTSPDGYERLQKQMEYDDGGIGAYSVAVFGEPGKSAFEWELTGRHLTLRADGNSVDKAAFGGPIIYGHGLEGDPKANLFHYQTRQVNEVFKGLDARQAEQALVSRAPNESAVALQGESGKFPGVRVGDLSSDQKELVLKTIQVLLAPYRQDDVDEVMEILKSSGGVDKLHMAFYQQDDLNADKVWDIWRVEGPSFVWHFRGAPHVHAYINIGMAESAKPA